MTTAAKAAYGTLIKRNGTTIPGVFNGPKGPTASLDAIDATSHDSTSGIKEFIGGLIDRGSVSFSVEWDPDNATHTGLFSDMTARTVQTFTITLTDSGATVLTFTALVVKLDPSADVPDKIVMDVELKISGNVTFS
jgi:predicted secreted protein